MGASETTTLEGVNQKQDKILVWQGQGEWGCLLSLFSISGMQGDGPLYAFIYFTSLTTAVNKWILENSCGLLQAQANESLNFNSQDIFSIFIRAG